MIKLRSSLLDWIVHRRGLRRWRRAARGAATMPLSQLRTERARARQLRHFLNDLISVADNRLALPMIGSNAFPKPHGTDWSWRPKLWREPLDVPGMSSVESKSRLGNEITLFHDCQQSELTLRQLRNNREADLAPYGLRMDVFRFDGSFLSLLLDLPSEAVQRLQRRHLIRMHTIIEMEKPLEIFVRLNIKHGPNAEQIVRELPLHEDDVLVEFDLAYSNLNEKRIERAWVDLIFENPEMSQLVLRDLTFCRHPRADL
ncbi:hypothetical protein HAT86_05305 [Roseovarius gahaiensis]|uniref:Uncharacterized protein n=1 Tax=Roseovarius gahaiensis TaxID=2716691 RepID=A0A967BBR4_9RHOB|nr:DUF6478 family protein [Roseovarius gahaiensis]NHQ73883.1 hypothetical protein [Roseovarius gahaiensis]